MHARQTVAEMVDEVLVRQTEARVRNTGEPFGKALAAVLETEAGRQLETLRDGPHRGKEASRWQADLPRRRAAECSRDRREELAWDRELGRAEGQDRVRRDVAWEKFMRTERRRLARRKDGELAGLLGVALPGETPEALRRLASEDRRQAEEGVVALLRAGEFSFKHLNELSPEDEPARVAAEGSRAAWLKERRGG